MAEVNDDARADQQLAVVPDNDPAPFDAGKAELEAARRAVEEEDAALAAAGQTTEAAAAVAPVAPAVAAPAAEPAAPPAPIMVPKQRLDALAQRARAAEAEMLRLQGELRAVTARQAAPAAPAAPPAPTLDQLLQAEQTKIDEAATKFDAGEITMSDFVAVQRVAQNSIQSLREQALYEALASRQPQMGMADELILTNRTAELEAANPWLGVIAKDGNRLQALADVARADLAARGEPIQGDSPLETLRLREATARLSNRYGPEWYPNLVQPAPAAAAPPGAPAPAAPAMPPARPAPVANPVLRAAAHPPNINTMGTAGLASNDPTEEQIENMSSDEIGALPAATRARLLAR
jgi:hypothetical protein